MTTYGEILGDALTDVAYRLLDAADALRVADAHEHDADDERRRKSAAERARRYRARRGVTRDGVTERDASRVTERDADPEKSSNSGAPLRGSPPERGNRRNDEGAVTRDASRVTDHARERDAVTRDDQPSSPWRVDPPTDLERENGHARIAEIRREHGLS